MEDSGRHVPILIAGAGPVGLTLAMELAKHGVESLVVEQRHSLSPLPRAGVLNARTMQIFRRLGIHGAIKKVGNPPTQGGDFIIRNQILGDELYRFRQATPAQLMGAFIRLRAGEKLNLPNTFLNQVRDLCDGSSEMGLRIAQNRLEPVLKYEAQRHRQVELKFGWQLSTFEQDELGVTAEIRSLDTAEVVEVRADYLIGCDGVRSEVRHEAGIAMDGTTPSTRLFSVYFKSPNLEKVLAPPAGFSEILLLNSKRNATLTSLGQDQYALNFVIERDSVAETRSPAGWIRLVAGGNLKFEVEQTGLWRVNYQMARRFRSGRVFLAGDAAHIMPGIAALGLNAGIQDAQDLGWKLAAVVNGWGGPKLLESYDGDRRQALKAYHSIAQDVLGSLAKQLAPQSGLIDSRGLFGAIYRFFYGHVLANRYRKQAEFRFSSPPERYATSILNYDVTAKDKSVQLKGVNKVSPGDLAPHKWLDEKTSLYDKFSMKPTLLCFENANAEELRPLLKNAKSYGMPLNIIHCDKWSVQAAYGWRMVLIRPDGHIAWCGEELPKDPEALIRRVYGWGREGRPQNSGALSDLAV